MPRGRTPDGEHTLSNAERQARYRASREADQPAPAIRYWRPVDRRSSSQRWNDLVAGLFAPGPGRSCCWKIYLFRGIRRI